MIKILLALFIICAGFYLRLRYEKKYVLPILSENKKLATLRKLALFFILLAIFGLFLKLMKLAFFIMIILIPIVIYLNFKVYRLANMNYLEEKRKKRMK